MRKPAPIPPQTGAALPGLPGWIGAGGAQGLEEAAFASGAALAHLQGIGAHPDLPAALWRDRLALYAAEACAGFAGRRESQAGLRDALHLLRPGDHPGPAGEIAQQWSRAAERPLTAESLGRALPGLSGACIAEWLEAGPGASPVARAAAVLEAVLIAAPRAETAALILADAALARALGWAHLLPLLALTLKPRDLRLRGEELRRTCHRAVMAGAGQAVPLAADLARRAPVLRALTPKLRARGADRAVQMFLARDAVAPAALAGFMSDRAARRLCDRLVALGAVRELTGRGSFRLYGL